MVPSAQNSERSVDPRSDRPSYHDDRTGVEETTQSVDVRGVVGLDPDSWKKKPVLLVHE